MTTTSLRDGATKHDLTADATFDLTRKLTRLVAAAGFDAADAGAEAVCCADGVVAAAAAAFCLGCDSLGLEGLCNLRVRRKSAFGCCCCCALPVSSPGRSNSPDGRAQDVQFCHLKIIATHVEY